MVELKSIYKCAWAPETTLGDNGNGAFTALIAGDTAYLIGDHRDIISIPIKSDQIPFYLANSHNYDGLATQKLSLTPTIPVLLMNGIPFYYALGVSADGADGATKTHAITTKTPSQALPSFTLHYEATDKDGTSNIYKDVLGCRVDELILTAARFSPVVCQLNCIGLDIVDSVTLTTDPALRATAVDKAFNFGDGTFTWHGSPQNHIQSFSLRVKNNLQKTYVNRTAAAYRAKYLDSWEQVISWAVVLDLKNKTWIDEIKAAVGRTFTIAFQRTDANDTVTITLANSVVETAPLQYAPFERNTFTLAGTAKTCAVAVRDAIATYP